MSAVSYTHRLDPRTDANLTAAILAVGNLLGVSPIADSILEHLKDRIGDTLSSTQRLNPHSIYASDLLGRVTEYVKETYGIDKPVNIHAAPQGPQGREAPLSSDSVFALDGLGRNRFEQLTGGTSGSYARMVADTANSSAAYSAMTVWNPSSGAAGLNEFNFGGTPFAQSGLDLATTKHLFNQGFSAPQIVNAAADLKALGLNPKDQKLVEGAATQERFDPSGRGQRQQADRAYNEWTAKNADDINRRVEAIQSMQPGTPEYEAAVAELDQLLEEGYVNSGQAAADEHLATVEPAPGAKPGDRDAAVAAQGAKRAAILDANGVDVEAVNALGLSASRNISTEAAVGAKGDIAQPATEDQIDSVTASDNFFAAASPDVTPPTEAPAPPDEEPAKPNVKVPPPPGPGGIGHN